MLTRKELLEAISECESAPMSYQNCEKLATFYLIYDHLFSEPVERMESVPEMFVQTTGTSDFSKAINGKSAKKIYLLMDELIESVQALMPNLYDAFMRRLDELNRDYS